MAYNIEPGSSRHELLKMAAKVEVLAQTTFCREQMRSIDTHGWGLAETMAQYGLISYNYRSCSMLEKGQKALGIVNAGNVYNAETNGADETATKRWKAKASKKKASIFPGKNNTYMPATHVHNMIESMNDIGVEATIKKFKKLTSEYKKHFNRITNNKLITGDKLNSLGRLVLVCLDFNITVRTDQFYSIDNVYDKIALEFCLGVGNTIKFFKKQGTKQQNKNHMYALKPFQDAYTYFHYKEYITDKDDISNLQTLRSAILKSAVWLEDTDFYCRTKYDSSMTFTNRSRLTYYQDRANYSWKKIHALLVLLDATNDQMSMFEQKFNQYNTLYTIQYS